MSGKRQHYLPASLLGGFGERAPTAKSREAKLVARRKATGRVDRGTCKAENEAFRIGMYRLAAPPPGVDRDIIDRLWNPVEGALPDLIRRLTDGKLSRGDDQLLFSYVAMAAVRHLSFEDVAKDWQNRHGGAPPVGDQVQLMRAEGLRNQLAQLVLWRWRVLHVPTDVSQLMVTDRGWMYVGEPERQDHSLFLPMGPRVALLGYLDSADLPPRRPPFEEHRDLCLSWVEWFNAAAWDDPFISAIYAHPKDRHLLEALPDHRHLRVSNRGPYRYRVTTGLMD